MQTAVEYARRAAAAGEVPVGAVVVSGGQVVGAAGNQREATGDPTAHAEILAMRQAARRGERGDYQVQRSMPPSNPARCAQARWWRPGSTASCSAADPKAGACGSLYNLCADPRLNHELTVVPGVREAECAALLRDWFADRRGQDPAS